MMSRKLMFHVGCYLIFYIIGLLTGLRIAYTTEPNVQVEVFEPSGADFHCVGKVFANVRKVECSDGHTYMLTDSSKVVFRLLETPGR